MDKESLKRRLREAEGERDILLHQLTDTVKKVDHYKEILEDLEDKHNEHNS